MSKKSIVIIILLLVGWALTGAYAVFGPNGYKAVQDSKDFLEDVVELQSNLSYYVGSSYSDAFGVYSKVELLSGLTEDGEKIKDNEDNILPEFITLENSVDYKDGEKAYELNMDNVNTTLKTSIKKYEGITFYVVDGDLIKIKVENIPDWWNDNFDVFCLN